MKHPLLALALLILAAFPLSAQRLASDYEIAQQQKLLSRRSPPLEKIAAHLNLGDAYRGRQELRTADQHYDSAFAIAEKGRTVERGKARFRAYATMTGYSALAAAKRGNRPLAFDLFEEAVRYSSDSPKLWNLYASGMLVLGDEMRAVSTARNAVNIAASGIDPHPNPEHLLDLNVYRFTLASALTRGPDGAVEAESILRSILDSLEGSSFDDVRSQIVEKEAFEVNSSTSDDASSYVSLMNRTRLRLAKLAEDRGAQAEAAAQYRRILELRTDDPVALAALARLQQREEDFAAAFEANPFSLDLIHSYEGFLERSSETQDSMDSTGSRVRRAVAQFVRGQFVKSTQTLEPLRSEFRGNEVIEFLLARNQIALGMDASSAIRQIKSKWIRDELRKLAQEETKSFAIPDQKDGEVVKVSGEDLGQIMKRLRSGRLTADERSKLDRSLFRAQAQFDSPLPSGDSVILATGTIGRIHFRFPSPTTFRFDASAMSPVLPLEFRILGLTESRGNEALLLEPLRVVFQ